jgi:hypothetical protein
MEREIAIHGWQGNLGQDSPIITTDLSYDGLPGTKMANT